MSTNQPKERLVKKILVSVQHRGRISWALVTARKMGNKYRVSQAALNKLSANVPEGSTFTTG